MLSLAWKSEEQPTLERTSQPLDRDVVHAAASASPALHPLPCRELQQQNPLGHRNRNRYSQQDSSVANCAVELQLIQRHTHSILMML